MPRRLPLLLVRATLVMGLAVSCAQPAAPTPTATKPAAQPTAAPTQPPKAGATATPATATAAPKAAASPAPPKPLSPRVAVKIGILGITADAGVFIALERGYFAEEGLDVELVRFVSGAEVIPPLATGELHFGSGSINPGFFNAVARGVDLKIVADKSTVATQLAGAGLMARKDLYDGGQLKELAQLKGKTIALNLKATTSEMYVEKILQRGGVKLQEVSLVEMAFPDMLAALANKSIDAMWTVEPYVALSTQRGMASLLYPMWQVYPNHYTNAMIISPVFARQQPEASKRFIAAHLRGQRDYYDAFVKKTAPIDPIVEVLTKHTAIKDVALLKAMNLHAVDQNGFIKAEFLADDQEYYASKGYVTQKVDTSKLVDFQYVEYALQRLGKRD